MAFFKSHKGPTTNEPAKPGFFARLLHKVWQHKFLWTSIFFVVVTGFLDSNSYWNRRALSQVNDSLRNEIQILEEKCHRDSTRLKQLKRDPDAVIHVAREVYFMKRENEDVYIVN